jgi:hypothetical protein
LVKHTTISHFFYVIDLPRMNSIKIVLSNAGYLRSLVGGRLSRDPSIPPTAREKNVFAIWKQFVLARQGERRLPCSGDLDRKVG